MSEFIVSARKYRPTTWESVIGQRAITETLVNAINTNKLAHAYLFCGPRGVGKTTCARIFAKTINMEDGKELNEHAFNVFELDAASNNSVDDIRQLTDQVRIPPQHGTYKVYIIDEVHMLSSNAFNAFLKTLEEPPPHAIFILATTEKHKIIPTILSRCQIFDFNRIQASDIANHLQSIAEKEEISTEPKALALIAQKADGALRDALSMFDQLASFTGKNLTYASVLESLNILDYDYYFKITDICIENQIPSALMSLNEVLNKGFDGRHFINGLAAHFRDLLVSKDQSTITLLDAAEDLKQQYLDQSTQTPNGFLLKGIELLNKTDLSYKASKNKRLLVELALMQLCSITSVDEKKKDQPLAGQK
ncbi:MAG: DNA polymerase III subunit gamma/tau [Flavobacteriales bacterium]|nr:DNA polymerase III subunit gamma/tau [Flavobacteriales bacterium]